MHFYGNGVKALNVETLPTPLPHLTASVLFDPSANAAESGL